MEVSNPTVTLEAGGLTRTDARLRLSRCEKYLLALFLLSVPLCNPVVHGDGVGSYALAQSLLIEHRLDFGNLKLSAVAVVTAYSGEVVLFSGVLATPRTLAEIRFELPRRVESLKQCAAWIVWHPDQHSSCGTFKPARHVGWIGEGRQNLRFLPWVSRAEYEARPQCTVQRDWLRLALKTLGEHLASLPDNAIVVFSFDGSVFSIRCDKKVIAFPGEGLPWTVCFSALRSPEALPGDSEQPCQVTILAAQQIENVHRAGQPLHHDPARDRVFFVSPDDRCLSRRRRIVHCRN